MAKKIVRVWILVNLKRVVYLVAVGLSLPKVALRPVRT